MHKKYQEGKMLNIFLYQNTSCMMHMGEMTKTFIGIGKEAQADIKPEDAKHATNVATLLGIDCEWMINYFCSKFCI